MSECIQFLTAIFCCGWSEQVTVNGRTLRVKRLLGEGGYAKVWLVEDERTLERFAMKKCLTADPEKKKQALKEAEMLKTFSHPNIVKMFDHVVRPSITLEGADEIIMLLEYHANGTVQDLIERMAKEKFELTELEILKLFIPLCEAVALFHTHKPPLAHRDLKPSNILLDKNKSPVLIDFGSIDVAKVEVNSRKESLVLQDMATDYSTPAYRAPELFDADIDAVVDERVDIWALGCSLYALAFHENPFDSAVLRGGNIKMAVINGNWSFPVKHTYSEVFCDLIKYLLNTNAAQRPTIKNVLKRANKTLRAGLQT